VGRAHVWRSEFRNVLAYYIRKSLLSLNEAHLVMDEAKGLMSGNEYEVMSTHVLNLVSESTCSTYDYEFVTLAQDLSIPLVTVDRQILEQFPRYAHSLGQIISL